MCAVSRSPDQDHHRAAEKPHGDEAVLVMVPPVVLDGRRGVRERLPARAMSSPLASSVAVRFAASHSIRIIHVVTPSLFVYVAPHSSAKARRQVPERVMGWLGCAAAAARGWAWLEAGAADLFVAAAQNSNPSVIAALIEAGAPSRCERRTRQDSLRLREGRQGAAGSGVYWRLHEARFK